MLGLPVPAGFRKDTLEPIKNIKDMVAVRPYDIDPGSGKMVQSIAMDLDGRLIAKVTQQVQPTLTDQQILAGITVDQVPYSGGHVLRSGQRRSSPERIQRNRACYESKIS